MIADKKSYPSVTESGVTIFGIDNRVKIIILSLVVFFASQKLYFKTLYQINFPYSIDHALGLDYVYTYVKTGIFPFDEFFAPFSDSVHQLIFRLIKFDSHHKKWIEKKWLTIWLACTIVIGLIYYSQFPKDAAAQPNFLFLFTYDGFSFLVTFISSAFRLKYDFLMVSVGSISLALGSFCVYYFTIHKRNLKIALPWLLFLLVGIGGGLIADVGRGDLPMHYGNETYYIPISQFFQIGLLVLISLIILDIKKGPLHTRKKILLYFLLAVIVGHMILLIPSYYAGWLRGEHYFQLKTEDANCYSLSPKLNCIQSISHVGTQGVEALPMINFWIENKLSIFGDAVFNNKNLEEISYFEETWNKNNETSVGIGEIELINNIPIVGKRTVYVNEPLVIISGSILDEKEKQLDSVFLLVDDKPFIKFDNSAQSYSEWKIFFMSGYLENNCQLISIAGFKDNKNIRLNQEIELCKNNLP